MLTFLKNIDLHRKYVEIKLYFTLFLYYLGLIPYFFKLAVNYYFKTDAKLIHKELRYHHKRKRNTLNIYKPAQQSNEKHPVIVFVHGGTWISGHAMHYHYLAQYFQQKGYLVVALNYTLFPNAFMDEIIEDVTNGIQWAFDHVEEYDGDKSKMILLGHSAGAHLTMSTMIQKYNTKKEQHTTWQPSDFKGFIALSGVYDLVSHYLLEKERKHHVISPMAKATRGIENLQYYSPSLLLQRAQKQDSLSKYGIDLAKMAATFPKTFLFHGTADAVLPVSQSQKMTEMLNEEAKLKNKAEFTLLEKYGHSDPVTCFLQFKDAEHFTNGMWQMLENCLQKSLQA